MQESTKTTHSSNRPIPKVTTIEELNALPPALRSWILDAATILDGFVHFTKINDRKAALTQSYVLSKAAEAQVDFAKNYTQRPEDHDLVGTSTFVAEYFKIMMLYEEYNEDGALEVIIPSEDKPLIG